MSLKFTTVREEDLLGKLKGKEGDELREMAARADLQIRELMEEVLTLRVENDSLRRTEDRNDV